MHARCIYFLVFFLLNLFRSADYMPIEKIFHIAKQYIISHRDYFIRGRLAKIQAIDRAFSSISLETLFLTIAGMEYVP
jgi:hypothetical protein